MAEKDTTGRTLVGALDSWPVIPLRPDVPILVGRSSSCQVALHHASISRRHARLTLSGDSALIEDMDSRFGTFVNGARIRRHTLRTGDVVRFGSSRLYRFGGRSLLPEADTGGMHLSLTGVGVYRGGRKLLDDVNFSIPPGCFLGVLGPSGAGKSLLLGCLSSTIDLSRGTISFDNGLPVSEHLDYYRSRIGVVAQDDLVYEGLTVRENLYQSARLRLPKASAAHIGTVVTDALGPVGLEQHQDKLVRVLSGGQRKRVSITIELLVRPRLLLLDEPTSGLDPGMQATLMDILRALSRRGITVVCTTHTMDTLHFFDSVAVIGLRQSVGGLVYHGPPSDLLHTFGVRNPADLFDKLLAVTGVQPSLVEVAESKEPGEMTSAPGMAQTKTLAGVRLAPQQAASGSSHLFRQARVVVARALLAFLRDRLNVLFFWFQPFLLALLVLLTQHRARTSIGVHFYLIICALWFGMTMTVREIVRERALYVRDRLNCLAPRAYLGGKLAFAFLRLGVQALILGLVAKALVPSLIENETVRQNLQDTSSASLVLMLFVVAAGGALVGLMISTVAGSEASAVALLPLALLPQILFSRVSFGDGMKAWNDPSAFGPLINIFESGADSGGAAGAVVKWLSLMMLTRPGVSVLDMSVHGVAWATIVVESLYLAALFALHLVVLYRLFLWMEKRWLRQR